MFFPSFDNVNTERTYIFTVTFILFMYKGNFFKVWLEKALFYPKKATFFKKKKTILGNLLLRKTDRLCMWHLIREFLDKVLTSCLSSSSFERLVFKSSSTDSLCCILVGRFFLINFNVISVTSIVGVTVNLELERRCSASRLIPLRLLFKLLRLPLYSDSCFSNSFLRLSSSGSTVPVLSF